MTTGDFCSDRQWHSTGIYADLKRPSCAGKTLVIPLPGPPGIARRLLFLRGPGRPFGEEDRSAAVLLQPHICESLRLQARREAARLLTARQIELLRLVAVIHPDHAASRRVAEKIGMRDEETTVFQGDPAVIYATERQ